MDCIEGHWCSTTPRRLSAKVFVSVSLPFVSHASSFKRDSTACTLCGTTPAACLDTSQSSKPHRTAIMDLPRCIVDGATSLPLTNTQRYVWRYVTRHVQTFLQLTHAPHSRRRRPRTHHCNNKAVQHIRAQVERPSNVFQPHRRVLCRHLSGSSFVDDGSSERSCDKCAAPASPHCC